MKIYLDQMFRIDVAEALRLEGYDVVRTFETGQSRSDDSEILQKAIDDNRVLITLDKHFGDWTVLPLNKHPGVIRIQIHPAVSKNIIGILIPFLKQYASYPEQFKNKLVIVSSKRSKWIKTC